MKKEESDLEGDAGENKTSQTEAKQDTAGNAGYKHSLTKVDMELGGPPEIRWPYKNEHSGIHYD